MVKYVEGHLRNPAMSFAKERIVSMTKVRDYIGVHGTHAEILAMLASFP